MGKTGKNTREQLGMARRPLRELPVKDTRCSPEEAAAFLEKDFKRAFRRGYTPKELCALLKKAGIVIPERLVARYQEPGVEEVENREVESEKPGSNDEGNNLAHPQKKEETPLTKDTPTTSRVRQRPMRNLSKPRM